MLTRERKSMLLAIILLALATLACSSEYKFMRDHEVARGLTNWKYVTKEGTVEEAKYIYGPNGEIRAIQFYYGGKPIHFWSFFSYYDCRDSSGKQVKYRVCTRREYRNFAGEKVWDDTTEVAIVKGLPRITRMDTHNADGSLRYRDSYTYDEEGRKLTAERAWATDGSGGKDMYTFDNQANTGIEPVEYYFETPDAYYGRALFISWCTVAEKGVPPSSVAKSRTNQ